MALIQIVVFAVLLIAITPLMGWWLYRVFEGGEIPVLGRVLGPVERLIYRVAGVDSGVEMRWGYYAVALLVFNMFGFVVLWIQLMVQQYLPLNPMHIPNMSWHLALNSAMSFVTNTNWQAYSGEQAVTPLSQMTGLALQNFLSAATGLTVGVALIRGMVRHNVNRVGNFWVDLTRSWLYILLPLSIIVGLFYVAQGSVQTLGGSTIAHTVEGAKQLIITGPVASQEAIKQVGTNGGGYFNANSAHPFEGPTPFMIFVQMLTIFAIPAGLTWMFGKAAGDQRQGWAIFAAMFLLFAIGVGVIYSAEQSGTNLLTKAGAKQAASANSPGGNMEGKETRFGIGETALYGTVTTAASNGGVIGMHDSFTPLGGGMALLNIMLGEDVFGGVGVGLAGMLLYAILAVFIAGLMVGRTPEYIGKKIEAREVRMALLAMFAVSLSILLFSAISDVTRAGLAGRLNMGPHGFTEILYAFTSGAGNNGSAFAGLTANTPYYNVLLTIDMFIGRFFFIVPMLAIAGYLSAKKRLPPSAGTLPTGGPLFVGLLIGVVVIVGALTFFPSLALGPIVEHLLMRASVLF